MSRQTCHVVQRYDFGKLSSLRLLYWVSAMSSKVYYEHHARPFLLSLAACYIWCKTILEDTWHQSPIAWRINQLFGPCSAFTVSWTHHVRMLGRHYKFDVDLLSYVADTKVKHCSQMKLSTKCVHLYPVAFLIWTPCYVLNLCSKTLLQEKQIFFHFHFRFHFMKNHFKAFGKKPKTHSGKWQNSGFLVSYFW